MSTSNQKKFQDQNPIQRLLIGRFRRQVTQVLTTIQPRSILEVGCGEGYLLSVLHQEFPATIMRGLDINSEALAEGRTLFSHLDLRSGDIFHIGEPDASWDVVIASEVLEHLADPVAALRELRRVAKRAVLLSVPHEPWFSLGNLARGRHIVRFGNHPEHVNQWSKPGFAKVVRQEFSDCLVTGSFPWTIILATK